MEIRDLLEQAVRRKASDLHVSVDAPPILRIDGKLVSSEGAPATPEGISGLLRTLLPDEGQRRRFAEQGELDFAYSVSGLGRFRVNAYRQRGTPALAIRVIPFEIRTMAELGLPDIVASLALKPHGLVLVTGPTGSGKSTTLAAMIDLINTQRSCHIVTIEDPIEYLHKHKHSIINQREMGIDTLSFANALRAALRQDPDVILVGEMRDFETISIAITAAETGHLVLATLHTTDATQAIDRLVDVFPPHQQDQIKTQLSVTLQGVIAQQLLPRIDGPGRVAAFEILVATPAVRNLIREGKTHQIPSAIQTGAKHGMRSMENSLRELAQRGLIAEADIARWSALPSSVADLM